jgi:hypothetical protein
MILLEQVGGYRATHTESFIARLRVQYEDRLLLPRHSLRHCLSSSGPRADAGDL